MMLPTIYLVGLTPALLAAWLDHLLAKRNVSCRIALTALFGYVISYLPLAAAFWIGSATGHMSCCSVSSGRCRRRCVRSWRRSGRRRTSFRHHDRIRSSGRE